MEATRPEELPSELKSKPSWIARRAYAQPRQPSPIYSDCPMNVLTQVKIA